MSFNPDHGKYIPHLLTDLNDDGSYTKVVQEFDVDGAGHLKIIAKAKKKGGVVYQSEHSAVYLNGEKLESAREWYAWKEGLDAREEIAELRREQIEEAKEAAREASEAAREARDRS